MEEEVKKAEVKKSEVKILVSKCKGLNQSKPSPQFFVTTKAEFGQTFLGESGKVELNHETGYFNFEFTSSLMLTGSDPMVLDEIAQTPVVVTFNEILPKDKKAKEEKTNTVGKCCIDLLPLLKGETNFSVNLPIHAINQDSQASEQALPVVHVNVSMEKPLLTEEQLENCNLLTLCVENLFSPPESWTPNGQFSYAACLQMPVSNEKETPVMMPSGTFRNPGEKEISDQRKWSCVPMASGSSLYIPNTKIPHHVIEEENGDLRKKEDIEFRELVESQKPRITWNAERRCFFNRQASFSFQQQIAQFRRWPIEVVRIANNAPSHQKAKHKDDDNNTSFHGVAYVDLAPLLYPGVNKISGAFLIQPFSETEMTEKFEKNTILTEENLKTMMDATRSHSSLGHAKGAGGGGGHGKPKVDAKVKQSTVNMGSKIEGDETSTTVVSEAHEYIEARSYVVIEVELEKPLVRKKEIEEIKERISSIIPPRPAYQKKQGGSEKAISDFEEQIGKSANVILEEFRKSFSGIKLSETLNDAEERRKQFFYYLNSTGKYCALKEQIKHFVIKIVREKFLYTSNFKDNEEMQRFTTDLYRFLLDHMHQGLNKYLTSEETAEIPPSIFDSSLLRRFAKEAEDMLNFEEAAKYYQELLGQYLVKTSENTGEPMKPLKPEK
ncbi:cilia- and flagella-associated protein 70-like [Clytia hemisphaerica]|uniref:cilia- and flagella-associated protein 70-like n=1 Tax=Clytia hemisphaerica TaxID=252671 RepID=UPI0034D3A49F